MHDMHSMLDRSLLKHQDLEIFANYHEKRREKEPRKTETPSTGGIFFFKTFFSPLLPTPSGICAQQDQSPWRESELIRGLWSSPII